VPFFCEEVVVVKEIIEKGLHRQTARDIADLPKTLNGENLWKMYMLWYSHHQGGLQAFWKYETHCAPSELVGFAEDELKMNWEHFCTLSLGEVKQRCTEYIGVDKQFSRLAA
jgi:hypothetical protein